MPYMAKRMWTLLDIYFNVVLSPLSQSTKFNNNLDNIVFPRGVCLHNKNGANVGTYNVVKWWQFDLI